MSVKDVATTALPQKLALKMQKGRFRPDLAISLGWVGLDVDW